MENIAPEYDFIGRATPCDDAVLAERVAFEAYRAAEDAKKFKVVSKYATSRYSTREEARVVCEKLNELGELADVVEL
jgi:hypothetical protein|tara:strand:+ start:5480 stop:5710 length:231 start_codon:yes stop_codon:yes gene_type:complete